MKVLLAGPQEGFGARDHAIAWRLVQSSLVDELFITRGNAATEFLVKTRNISTKNGEKWEAGKIVALAKREQVDIVVVGPENQLAAGIVDMLEKVNIPVFGPTQSAARLETSKSCAVEWMRESRIPHARSWIFNDQRKALKFVRRCTRGIVVKLDGLAYGKGVWVCKTKQAAIEAVKFCIQEHPGEVLVMQELLYGVEVSVFCFTDGYTISASIAASDYKPRFDKDKGPNTGSMGSFSPPMFWNDRLAQRIQTTVLQPIVDTMRKQGIIYKGIIYAGLMLTAKGPQVLEFNCRFGDTEAQVILPLLDTDLIEVMTACSEQRLHEVAVKWNRNLVAATVVMVDEHYPNSPQANNGDHVHGLDSVEEEVIVFHYGTTLIRCHNGKSYVAVAGSGRRLSVTAVGKSYEEIFLKIYCSIGEKGITFPGAAWRSDIGKGRDLPKTLVPLYS